jgi:apolipoprotein N-acyltransferase
LETIMSFPRSSPAVAVWLLAAAVAFGTGEAWAAYDMHPSKLQPWVLLALFWGVALLSAAIHYLLRALPQAAAWLRQRAPSPAVATQGWELVKDATRRGWEQQMAGARRAPAAVSGTVIGWSRSARKALRA